MGRKSLLWIRLGALAAWTLLATPAAAQLSIFPGDPNDTFNAASDCNGGTPLNCSLREAVVLANQTPGQDTIFLQLNQYNLTIPRAPADDATSGDLDITDDTIVTDLTPGSIIDGGGSAGVFQDRLFHVNATGTLTLDSIQLTRGYRNNEPGGAVRVDAGGVLAIVDCQLTGNAGNGGGAISVSQGGTADVDSSLISGNGAFGSGGGGIDCQGGLTVSRTSIESNSAGISGGIFVGLSCIATVTKSNISANQALNGFFGAAGGGIGVAACGQVTLNNVTVSGNTARGAGGGITIAQNFGFCPPGRVTANNVTIAFNTSDFDNNDATLFGGGVHSSATACASFPTYCLQVTNSIIANNKDATTDSDCQGLVQSGGNNMIKTSICPANTLVSDLITDPQLDPALAVNHGNWTGFDNDTKTHGLIAGSPAIDSGNAGTCETTDQRGIARVSTCDRGAFEADVCGNGTTRSPEECDPPSAVCTTQCRDDNPILHNTPNTTDKTTLGLVVAYQDCLVGNPGLTGPENTTGACNVKPFDAVNGPCEFDTAVSGAKGFVEVFDDAGAGGEIKFRLRLAKLKPACYGRQFRIKAVVDETLKDCTNGGLSCTEVHGQTTPLNDVASTGLCTVGNGSGGTTAGLCDYTAIVNGSSAHRVRNNHRTAMKIKEVKVIDVGTGLDAFVPGVLLK